MYKRQHGGHESHRWVQAFRLSAGPGANLDLGLLRGVDVETGEYYTPNLKMDKSDDMKWLSKLGLLWEAATKDAAARNMNTDVYVEGMLRALAKFKLSGEVHDRDIFYEFLRRRIELNEGQLLLVLGGKSVGKSLVLNDFKQKLAGKDAYLPILVDARSFSGEPLADGILQAYLQLPFVKAENIALNVLEVFVEGLFTVVDKQDSLGKLSVKGLKQMLSSLKEKKMLTESDREMFAQSLSLIHI